MFGYSLHAMEVQMQISQRDRELLAGIRLCQPCTHRHQDLSVATRLRARVLLPDRFHGPFAPINHRKGLTRSINPIDEALCVAESQLGKPYKRKAGPNLAPLTFSCSSFIQWVFAQVGVAMPRFAIDQSYIGRRIPPEGFLAGTLLFYKNSWPITDADRSIGHVAIAVSDREMIHGSSQSTCIVRENIHEPLLVTNVLASRGNLLVEVPDSVTGLETALDVYRWLQR
ncbi:MAG: C40 family peptidase [Parcubacteria group bacterium]|nr:C40 family peptidase [Parcubacteria group bacterium]